MSAAFAEAAKQIVRGLAWSKDHWPSYVYHTERLLTWRHHGLGMLQAELSDTLRIHIWDPSLVSEGMKWPRCVHDHRFDITSAVVLGEIIDVPCRVGWVASDRPFDATEEVNVYEIEHAKNQDRMVDQKGCSTATSAKKLTVGHLAEVRRDRWGAGTVYEIPRRAFHTTRVENLAITIVHRSNFDDRLARVLCAVGGDVSAVSGIVRDTSMEHTILVNQVLRRASDAIAEHLDQ